MVFTVTLQTDVNSSQSPYATDVGEIQNALPRWGTLHFSGYPLYSLLASTLVTLFRTVGIAPAAGASLVSALWAAATVAVLARLLLDLGAHRAAALLGSLLAAVSLSFWMDASLAEVHTMTMCLTFGTLLWAWRFHRSGARGDLLWLTLFFTQGVAHQRSVALLAPGLAVLLWPRWRTLLAHLSRRNAAVPILGIALLAPLTYLYLPVRAWQGAEWTFGQPGTWHGFVTMISDTKADRVISLPADLAQWWQRLRTTLQNVGHDMPLPLLAIGLAGLLARTRHPEPLLPSQRPLRLALSLAWLPYFLLCVVIWEGRVSDALLAIQLPVALLAAVGWALLATWWAQRRPRLAWAGWGILGLSAIVLGLINGPQVLAVTRDRSVERVVRAVAHVELPTDRPTTLMSPWGLRYWALRYAQTYRGLFPGLRIVDHNADLPTIVARGDHLLTLDDTFYRLPLQDWQSRLGSLHLSMLAPGVVELAPKPHLDAGSVPPGAQAQLGKGVLILSARLGPLMPTDNGESVKARVLTVFWQATQALERDYSVAVHVLADDPPAGPQDILGQADQRHPVGGWYPTTAWRVGEIVRDSYLLTVAEAAQPSGVRVGMYWQDEAGQFHNTAWLTLPWQESAP